MKIAVAYNNGTVSGHFGHCSHFDIYTVAEGQVTGHELVSNPGHKPGFLPVFLADNGVNVIISGGMGSAAVAIFQQKGIEVVVGATGDPAKAVNDYVAGELKSTGSICDDHQYEGTEGCGH